MKVIWGCLIRLMGVASLASLLGLASISFGADPVIQRLRVVALDSNARIAVVKLDDEPPLTWHVGASIALGNERITLRDCAGNRAIVEVVRSGAAPVTVLIARGDIYRVGAERDRSPMRVLMTPAEHR